MFVMSSLDFADYLKKLDATHAAQFPLPGDLPATQREGDFDVIVIHRKYGVLLGEIKSVGIRDNNPTDKAVADKVSKAVKQLDKCEKVVNHVMSDVAPGVSVRKTLILPYISRTQLQHVLDGDSQLAQRVCGCVGAPDVRAAVELCVCSDVMSDRTTPWDVDAAVLGKLDSCLAASRLIQQQLVMTLQADPTTQQAAAAVHFLYYDLYRRPGDVEAALQTLQSLERRPGHTETGANINPTSVGTTTSPPRLQYRDVLVLTRSDELREETRDVRGQVTSQACGVVRGLRSAGLPPINIPQTDHSLWTREQHPVARPINVQETDSRDDFAQQHVLYCLQTLGEQRQEAMFVMSSLKFTDYLKKLDATQAAQFPLPGDLPATQREGDFDVIVIHRKYGVLLGEIKSVGIHGNNPTDKAVADKVTKAVKQLDKCEKVVDHVMSDVAPGVSVRKTLILPYISRTQLQHVLDGDSQLAQT
nr:hypothetical protein BaRGS_017052 [Batillaria attramentaria]